MTINDEVTLDEALDLLENVFAQYEKEQPEGGDSPEVWADLYRQFLLIKEFRDY